MRLRELKIYNYKNVEDVRLMLSPKVNCFVGRNGMGKTNILDAIYYLSFAKSHAGTSDTANIRWGESAAIIEGRYSDEEEKPVRLCAGFKRGTGRSFKRDDKEYERISDHIGSVPLVIVSPKDDSLIEGEGADRRKFLDGVISQFDNQYLLHLLDFNRALSQRNSLLKAECADPLMYEIWEERMVVSSDYIRAARQRFLNDFCPLFASFHAVISDGGEEVSLSLRSQINEMTDYMQLLSDNRARDIARGHTTVGVHRDDLEMLIYGAQLRRVGSQGQRKSFLVALKLAQYVFLRRTTGRVPVLLFDDIFDKLDAERMARLVSLINSDEYFGQIFITDTDREHISRIVSEGAQDYVIYEVENGGARIMSEKGNDRNYETEG